jgi:hypothetical protein
VETTATPAPSYLRLWFWSAFVTILALINYAERFSVNHNGGQSASQVSVYSYNTFFGGLMFYAIWLGLILLICINRFDLLALRPPQSWRRGLKLAAAAMVAIWLVEVLISLIPLPQSPGHEQGITTIHWEPAHAGAFAANLVLFAVVAPFVEELTFRGAGQSLLRFLGSVPSILIIGTAFGLAHGLVEGLLVLVPFGIALAWLRDRTDSVVPGMFVHGIFNGVALAAAVLLT